MIFVHDVPLEQFKLSDDQPKLERKLATLAADSPERLTLLESIAKNPGLELWWQRYTTKS